MLKKVVTAVLTAGFTVTAGLGILTACGSQSFGAPENVGVDGNTLSWSAVEGATNGYTVRVAEDNDKTVTVSDTSLSLASGEVVTYFVSGENTLEVKVNATDDKEESAYSAPVVYTYTAPVVNTPFEKPSNLAINDGVLTWTAVSGAEKYIVANGTKSVEVSAASIDLKEYASELGLSAGVEATISVKVKATTAHTESEASTVKYTPESEEPNTEKLATPVLTLVDNVLSWTAVEGADRYIVYTDDSHKTEITATQIDLQAQAQILGLTAGSEATVYVKATSDDANKTDSDAASKTYTLPEPDPDAFAQPTGISVSDGVLSWTAVEGATNGYTVANGDDSISVTEVSVDLTQKKTELNLADGETYTTLTVKVNATDDMGASVPAAVPSFKMPGYTAAELAAIERAKSELNTALAEIPTDWTDVEAEDAEEYIATLVELLAGYEEYADVTKENEDVLALKVSVENALASARGVVKNSIDAIKEELNTLIERFSADLFIPADTDVEDLEALEEKVNSLGKYAQTLWTEELGKVLTDARKILSSIVIDTDMGQSSVLLNNEHSDRSALYVMRRYTNIFGDAIQFESAPNVTASENVTVNSSFNEDNGYYVWELAFAKIVAGSTDNVTISYTVDEESEVSVTLTAPSAVVYNVNVNDGKLSSTATNGETLYIDIYLSADVEQGTNGGDKDLILKGAPIVSQQEVTNGATTEDELKSFIARNGVFGTNEFTFVLYRLEEQESGALTYSNTSAASIMTKSYTVTEEDVKVRLNFTSVALEINDGGITFGRGGLSATFIQELTAKFSGLDIEDEVSSSKLVDYVRYYIDVTCDGITERIYLNTSLSVGSDGTGYSHVDLNQIKAEIYKAFGEVEESEFTLEIGFALSESAIEKGYGEYLRESLSVSFTKTYSIGNEKLANTWALDVTDGNSSDCLGYKWEVINNNAPYSNSAEVLIFRATENSDYTVESALTSYVKEGAGFIAWSDIDAALIKAWGALSDKQDTESFVFAIRALANEDGLASGYIDSDLVFMMQDGEIYQKSYTQDWTIPTDAQMFFRDQGAGVICVAQVKPNSNGRLTSNGAAFTSGGTAYVEVKLSKDGEEDIILYLFAEDGALKLYQSIDENDVGTGDPLNCAMVADGWVNVGDLNAFIGNDFDVTQWSISTRIVANDSGFYTGYPADNSDGWSDPETWDNRDGKTGE